jgi:hypothetical protein
VSDKESRNWLVYFLAAIGVAAMIYGSWTIYQKYLAEQQRRYELSAPVPSGLPNPLFATPGPPPPQP